MTTVYLLTAILITHQALGPMKVYVESHVFSDAARCLKSIELNRADLNSKYDQVDLTCTPTEIVPKEK